jgi:hypothetical protein
MLHFFIILDAPNLLIEIHWQKALPVAHGKGQVS